MANMPWKVCPVVLRSTGGVRQILAFEHPLAGKQLVKGGIEEGERVEDAALRELGEESGLTEGRVVEVLAAFDVVGPDQRWHPVVVAVAGVPERWTFHCLDDGGHDFRFFWHPLDCEDLDGWHPIFRQALARLRELL